MQESSPSVQTDFTDGKIDVVVLLDPDGPQKQVSFVVKNKSVVSNCQWALLRFSPDGDVQDVRKDEGALWIDGSLM